jgi:hypothetical protein
MTGILQVLPLTKSKNNVLKCHKKKDAQEEKERLIKNAKHCTETQEECAKCRKTICDSMMRKRQTETNEQGAKRKKTMPECVSKQGLTESNEQAENTRRQCKNMSQTNN